MITSLIGRQVKDQYANSDSVGTIVAVYLDRGELWVTVENAHGGLCTRSATTAQLALTSEAP